MGKKQFAVMEEHKKIFCEGAAKKNLDANKAAELYDLMAKFAEYGFNKSHAVAYALIAFQTAYLKCYHPGIFYAAMLGTEMGNADKVTALIQDAKEFDIDVLPPDINESNWNFNVVNDEGKEKIRFALGAVKNVGQGAVMAIVKERAENGPYRGIIDFVERVDLKALNKRVLESLIKVGALEKCDKMNRKTMLENLELIMSYGAKLQEEKMSGQFGLFDVINAEAKKNGTQNVLNINPIDDFESKEKLQYERELLGIYVSGHPLDKVAHMINELSSMPISGISELQGNDKRDVILAGMITQKKDLLTKKGDKMCFLSLEDLSGKIEGVVFPKTFQEYSSLLNVEEIVVMHGYINLTEEPKKLIVNKIRKLKEEADEKVKMIRIHLQAKEMRDGSLEKIKQVLLSSRGSTPAHIIIENELGRVRIPLSDEFNVTPTPHLAFKLNEIIKNNGVKFIVDGKVEEGASYRM
ncbi:MAG: OB-fold nucleic acid binding domain-containing protein [Bacteriovoracaceae bacterium]